MAYTVADPGDNLEEDEIQLVFEQGFRDPSTDGLVMVLAGLGRNGSEAAAQFATSPHYMELLRERIGNDLRKKNVEVLLKVRSSWTSLALQRHHKNGEKLGASQANEEQSTVDLRAHGHSLRRSCKPADRAGMHSTV